ncbi:MAG: hypothetical protein H6579_04385 [Chitinophagales bacterium]|nr:hypothetical protein [Chitinophagales bacterium]
MKVERQKNLREKMGKILFLSFLVLVSGCGSESSVNDNFYNLFWELDGSFNRKHEHFCDFDFFDENGYYSMKFYPDGKYECFQMASSIDDVVRNGGITTVYFSGEYSFINPNRKEYIKLKSEKCVLNGVFKVSFYPYGKFGEYDKIFCEFISSAVGISFVSIVRSKEGVKFLGKDLSN